MTNPPRGEGITGSPARPEELHVLGSLALRLTSRDLAHNLRECTEFLRSATGADDCEIFLREPEGGDFLLAECSGPDRPALQEQARFEPGVGYPGIVAVTGTPLASRRLDRDRRFLRRSATDRGIRSFLAVPLGDDGDPLGCIDLAWRSSTAPLESTQALLAKATGPVTAAVRARLLAARELLDRHVNAAQPGIAARAQACLHAIVELAGARSGTLALFDPDGRETAIFSTAGPGCLCAGAADGRDRCPMLAQGHGVALDGARDEWRESCRCLPVAIRAATCLPLRSRRRLHGVVVLDRGEVAPPVPGADLVLLLAAASEAAAWLSSARPWHSPVGAVTAPDPVLELRCLGGFEVRLHGDPVPAAAFTRRKALTALRILIMGAGNPISRDALIERLWPEIEPGVGANRLHGVLHALRSAIEPFHAQRRWLFVRHVGELYYFNMASPHWTDIYAFRHHVTSAQQAERANRRSEAIQHLETALELYRGDLFADEPYAAWCELERAELKRRYVDLTGHLARLWIAEHETDRGVAWLRRGLLADPLREDLHQSLIRTLLELGRRDEALAQYRFCAARLREELDAAPLPETEALARLAARDRVSPL